jgi:hypothetical protein
MGQSLHKKKIEVKKRRSPISDRYIGDCREIAWQSDKVRHFWNDVMRIILDKRSELDKGRPSNAPPMSPRYEKLYDFLAENGHSRSPFRPIFQHSIAFQSVFIVFFKHLFCHAPFLTFNITFLYTYIGFQLCLIKNLPKCHKYRLLTTTGDKIV